MKYFVLLCLISYALSMFPFTIIIFSSRTYFGEYFQCSLFDQCTEEYETCRQDNMCAYQMLSSPCIDPCGVDYAKFFSQMRSYNQTYNDSENVFFCFHLFNPKITPFPEASCDFQTCERNWIASLNNTPLNALKECELQKCLQAYPSYTFIAHEYAELRTCQSQILACQESETCKAISNELERCIEEKHFHVDPRTNPDQYFREHVNSFDNPIIQCLQVPETDPVYEALYNCVKPIWTQ